MSNSGETEVLIVGAGPTGLLAACELLRLGIAVRIIEKWAAPRPISKALVLQARTLEVLDIMGLVKPFLEQGYPAPGLGIGLSANKSATVDMHVLETRFPFMLVLPQNETEEILEQRLQELGGRVEREVSFTQLSQGENGVDVVLTANGAEEVRIHASFVIGCDGAHSSVRDAIGLPFEGHEVDTTVFLADVKLDADFTRTRITNFTAPRGFVSILPFMGEYARIFAADFDKQDVPPTTELTVPDLQETLDAIVPFHVGIREPRWITRFRSPSRKAPELRVGRVFIAGDAAHAHSPAGGQGMNNGLQDAFNLAWKLALVLKCAAPSSLLETYNLERHRVDAHAQQQTDRMFSSFMIKSRVLKAGRDLLMHAMSEVPAVRRKLAEELSGIGVDYSFAHQDERSIQTGLPVRALGAGQRMPDCMLWRPGTPDVRLFEIIGRPCYTALLFVGASQLREDRSCIQAFAADIEADLGPAGLLSVILDEGLPEELGVQQQVYVDFKGEFARAIGAAHGSLLLVRPDGYIALHHAGMDIDTIKAAFGKWISPVATAL